MDVITVLAETNQLHRAIRVAAHNVLNREEAKAYRS